MSPPLHPMLVRQLNKLGLSVESAGSAWSALLDRVSQAYLDADQDRYRLERSIAICSEEMSELNESLAAERDRLQKVFDSATVGIVRASPDATIIDCNQAYATMLGVDREALVGHKWFEQIHPAERAGAEARRGPVPSGKGKVLELRYLHADGTTVWGDVSVSTAYDASGAALFNIAIVRDITEQRELEITLRHAQKLEAVGRLAAGIAHEINTPLQFVGDNLSFLGTSLVTLTQLCAELRALCPDGPQAEQCEGRADLEYLKQELPRALSQSVDGVAHVGRIVQAMRVLSYNGRSEEQTIVDLNAALESVALVSRSETKFVADVNLALGDIPPIRAFSSDLNQVFLNLIVNAAHAVGDVVATTKKRGTIGIRTWRERDDILVTIEDSGGGIAESVRPHVFDPFFTTKTVGKGTGQGLAIARAIIVDKHGGSLTFESEVGRGTVFRVRLPIAGRASERVA